uniref:AbfB domain-containing protein n=1 Tax=Streptomyces resistomycificus TaxID=67356 RepID=UPI000AB8E15E|nr:AbfB domain-containing protein [Streptomyces resistomycificus]
MAPRPHHLIAALWSGELRVVRLRGRYIRHYDNLLYVQALSTATDRADATYYGQ